MSTKDEVKAALIELHALYAVVCRSCGYIPSTINNHYSERVVALNTKLEALENE